MVTNIKLDLIKVNEYLQEQAIPLKRKFLLNKDFAELFKYLPNVDVFKILKENTNLKQIAANRHYCQTGFLRTFDVEFVTANAVKDTGNKIVLFLTMNEDELINAGKLAQQNKNSDIIFGILKYGFKVANTIKNLQIYYVQNNSQKISELNCIFEKEAKLLFSEIDWYHRGLNIEFNDEQEFNSLLSDIFDNKYKYGLSIKNELLTAKKPPATLTKAFRSLVNILIESKEIKENSTEYVIYRELLSNIYKNGTFTRPENNFKLACIWDEIEKFIHTSDEKSNLEKLYQKLFSSPYGLTKSIISIILLAVFLSRKNNISIYENGSFQLKLTPILFDRLVNNPQNFEIQKNICSLDKRAYIEGLSKILLSEKSLNVLDIAKNLIFFVKKLDKYTLTTSKLSKNAQRLRDAILSAKEPNNLVTRDLPTALGFKTYLDCKDDFFKKLESSIQELKNNYEKLLDDLSVFFYNFFEESKREILAERFEVVSEFISNTELKILGNRVKESQWSNTVWIEKIATFINKSRIPKDWSDNDIADFKVKILQLAAEFKNLETISRSLEKQAFDKNKMPIRLGLTLTGKTFEKVFVIEKNGLEKLDSILKRVIETVESFTKNQKIILLTELHRRINNA